MEKQLTKQAIGDHIAAERIAQGKSLYQLSKECGVFQGHIRKIEEGKLFPRVDTLAKIYAALGWSVQVVKN